MPTYEYRCSSCGHQLEAVQSFSDEALTTCPDCGQDSLRKLFGNVGVVFKGSGFYRNDSREEAKKSSSGKQSKAAEDTASSSKSEPESKSKSESKSESNATSGTSSGGSADSKPSTNTAKPKSGSD